MLGRWTAAFCIVVAALVGLVAAAYSYPLGIGIALGTILVFGLVLVRYRAAWLILLPAVLPAANLSPWTGWLHVDEFDLLAVATLAIGYARVRVPSVPARGTASGLGVSPVAVFIVGLLATSYAVSAVHGPTPYPVLDANALATYDSPYNGLRILKPFALAILAWPLMLRELRDHDAKAGELVAKGCVLGLLVASAGVLWERVAFTGLTNFATDYRVVGTFWEMHTGGAALDGFLVLTIPFALWLLRFGDGVGWLAAGAVALASGAYSVLVTFSRSTYLAVGFGAAVLVGAEPRLPGVGLFSTRRWVLLGVIILFLALAIAVFASSGYRGLAAFVGLGLTAAAVGSIARGLSRFGLVAAGVAGGLVWGLCVLVLWTVPKGPYLNYAAAFLAVLATSVPCTIAPGGSRWRAASVASFVWLAAAAIGVATHWGGPDAAPASAAAAAASLVLVACNALVSAPLWHLSRATATSAAIVAIVGGAVAVGSGSYFAAERFSQVTDDLAGRAAHWSRSLGLLEGPSELALGKGLGTYPASYFWAAQGGDIPGNYGFAVEGANQYLTIAGARHAIGYGDPLRIVQRVRVAPGDPLIVEFRARSETPMTLGIAVCYKHLLYPDGCMTANVRVAGRGSWEHHALALQGKLPDAAGVLPKLQFFEVTTPGPGQRVDIDDVRLMGKDGRDLLVNGDYEEGMERWFFTSDRLHLPWHIKSLWLNFAFDQGIFGLLAFSAFFLAAVGRVTFGSARAYSIAPYLAIALVSFGILGLFDTLVDATRVAYLFFLLALLALSLPRRGRSA